MDKVKGQRRRRMRRLFWAEIACGRIWSKTDEFVYKWEVERGKEGKEVTAWSQLSEECILPIELLPFLPVHFSIDCIYSTLDTVDLTVKQLIKLSTGSERYFVFLYVTRLVDEKCVWVDTKCSKWLSQWVRVCNKRQRERERQLKECVLI